MQEKLKVIKNKNESFFTQDSLKSCKMSLGILSENFENVDEIVSNSYSISISQKLRCSTNNLGVCTVVVNPNFLMSKKLLTTLRNNNNIFVSNIFIANNDNEDFGDVSETIPVSTNNIILNDFDTYKFQRIEIYHNIEHIVEPVEDASNTLDCNDKHIKIQIVDGKSINIINDNQYVFSNHLINDLFNNSTKISSSKEYDENSSFTYNYNSQTLGIMEYNKNGCNSQNEPPLLVKDSTSIDDIVSKQFIKFENYLSGSNKYKFKEQGNISKLNYVMSLSNNNVVQNNIYNQSNQKNDKVVRILIKSDPYKIFHFTVNSYYTYKIINQNDKENVKRYHTPTILSFSSFEKDFKKILTIMSNIEPSLDGAYLNKLVNQYLESNDNGFIELVDSLWSKVKEIASPLANTIENAIKDVTNVYDLITFVIKN
jgi:hypothetical protein